MGQTRRQFCAGGGGRSCASLALATQLGTQDSGLPLEKGVFAHSVEEAVRAAFAHSLVACGPGLVGSLRALVWTLYSTMLAFFVTAVAAQLCTGTSAHHGTYWRYVLPWYLLNKSGVSDQTLGRLLGELTDDPALKELFKEHARVRALEHCGVEEKRRISVLDLAHWGGCLACQYWGVSPQAFRRDWALHVRLAAALHVLDDYLDQREDQELGAYNYFVNHPEPKDVAWWIQETLCCRAYFAQTDQLSIVRLIDGSLTFYGLADEFMFGTFFAQCDTHSPEFVAPQGLVAWRWFFAWVF